AFAARHKDSGVKVGYLPEQGEVIVVGDLHGDLASLENILKKSDFENRVQKQKDLYLVFLGDYVDRGKKQIDVLISILKLKKKYVKNVFLIRGNHETREISIKYGFHKELIDKYGFHDGEHLFEICNRLFEELCLFIVTANGTLLVHGGLPYIEKPPSFKNFFEEDAQLDILWNDPVQDDGRDRWAYSLRGALIFPEYAVDQLNAVGINKIIRAHEVREEPGEAMDLNQKVVTVFSTGLGSDDVYSGYKSICTVPYYVVLDLSQSGRRWHVNRNIVFVAIF
ncbi:metallophosphoesterase family protein, partial [bacterium]